MNRIDVDSMTTDQKLKLLQLSLHYVLPKLRSTEMIERKQEDLSLLTKLKVVDVYLCLVDLFDGHYLGHLSNI